MSEDIITPVTVPLLLSVTDILPYDPNNLIYPASNTISNNVGQITNCVSEVTWNVDLMSLLGDLYDKYDYFNLEMLQFMTIPLTGSTTAFSKPFQNDLNSGYRNLSVYISGLQWVNSSYSQKVNSNTNYCHLCNVKDQFTSENLSQVGNWRDTEYLYTATKGYARYDLMFRKQKHVKIKIRIGAIDTDTEYTPENVFFSSSFIMHYFLIKFNIVPFK